VTVSTERPRSVFQLPHFHEGAIIVGDWRLGTHEDRSFLAQLASSPAPPQSPPPAEEPGCPGGAWKKLQGPEAGPAHRGTGFHYWIAWKIVFTRRGRGDGPWTYPAVDG
jgi:hypothetical protein